MPADQVAEIPGFEDFLATSASYLGLVGRPADPNGGARLLGPATTGRGGFVGPTMLRRKRDALHARGNE